MEAKEVLPLTHLDAGQNGIVSGFDSGHGMQRRLRALGIAAGKKITKVGAMFMRGPVTVRMGNTQISIGHGMAEKILVEVEK